MPFRHPMIWTCYFQRQPISHVFDVWTDGRLILLCEGRADFCWTCSFRVARNSVWIPFIQAGSASYRKTVEVDSLTAGSAAIPAFSICTGGRQAFLQTYRTDTSHPSCRRSIGSWNVAPWSSLNRCGRTAGRTTIRFSSHKVSRL